MERDTGIIKERDYIVKTDRSPEEIEEAIKKSEEEMKKMKEWPMAQIPSSFLLGGIFMQQNKKGIRR